MRKKDETLEPGQVRVKIVAGHGDETKLVEYRNAEGQLRRVYLPAQAIYGEIMTYEDVEAGAPAFVEWEKVGDIQVTANEIAEALRSAGYWTGKDLLKAPSAASRVLLELVSGKVSRIIQIAKGE